VIGLAAKHGVEMPIATEVHRVLFEGKDPVEATDSLMQRPPRSE
jgi:glycerol-3-phosphate dehydrogenase (NAD(P)+)